jgi:hypothetical protein
MGSYSVDASAWPLVVHTVEGALEDDQIDAYVKAGTEVLLRRAPHAVILDIRKVGRISAYGRARNAQWQQQYRAELKAWCVCTAYVSANPLVRFITATVLLVGRPPMPYRIFPTIEEGADWAQERLRAHGQGG